VVTFSTTTVISNNMYVLVCTTDAVGSSLEVYEKTACWHLRIIYT
jgi:hypothetical protein